MPFVNDKFYANLLYGRALERARAADEGRVWPEDPDAEATPEIMLVGAHLDQAQRSGHHRHPAHGPDDYDAATTPEGVANQIYNETSGLRATVKIGTGPGTDWDMQQARTAIGHVIHNRADSKIHRGLASDQLTRQASQGTRIVGSSAYDAHGESVFAAHRADHETDPTSGATLFYLDHGQTPPRWAKGAVPTGVYGPFKNESGGGDVPKGASVQVKTFRVR